MRRVMLIILAMGLLPSVAWSEGKSTTKPAKTNADNTRDYHQVYREGFQPPVDAIAEAKRMRELIEKINQTSLPKYKPKSDRIPRPKTKKSSLPTVTTKTKSPAKTPASTTPEVLSTQTLKELARRVPETVADPIRLGDALYRSGHRAQALFVYEDALKKAKDPEDQVWLLYQMGCCLMDTKPAMARQHFQKVRATLPDSPWAELADIQVQLVDWTERNQPTQFLEDLYRDLRPRNERIESRQAQPRTGGKTQPAGSGVLGSSNKAPAKQVVKKELPVSAANPKTKPTTTLGAANTR